MINAKKANQVKKTSKVNKSTSVKIAYDLMDS